MKVLPPPTSRPQLQHGGSHFRASASCIALADIVGKSGRTEVAGFSPKAGLGTEASDIQVNPGGPSLSHAAKAGKAGTPRPHAFPRCVVW